ncbi:MAG TPA: flagellar biosynthetic protein FliQ, partial [Polyangiaceae bacterium]|nr:flagellar biosynthetic protein FliQ [Polyangiaceae bacterium]
LPVLGVAALVGLLVGVLQAVTQIHDSAVSHLPKLLAVVLALVLSGPWIGGQVSAFALRVFAG